MTRRILLLGGTAEASALARALAARGEDAVLSYAGRTRAPAAQPLPVRIGGFGGAAGLAAFLRAEGFTHLVDATHPFAARISRNAVEAARATGLPMIALVRPEWRPGPGDVWHRVPDIDAALAALDGPERRVFLALGRLSVAAFAARPQHRYLLRFVDPPQAPLPLPRADLVIARGPFDEAGETALLSRHGIEVVVAKNSGGSGAEAKLSAARRLGLPVVLIDRPAPPPRPEVQDWTGVLDWLDHASMLRGV
jgi:precorrin-6A/cobalt-precorrin-6A reductase